MEDLNTSLVAQKRDELISAEYLQWRKEAAPFLYHTVFTHALKWPSLTIQWLPEVSEEADSMISYYALLGDDNYLMKMKITMPLGEEGYENECSVTVVRKLKHAGGVHKLRWMPSRPSISATKGTDALVRLYGINHEFSADKQINGHVLSLAGHTKTGWALDWNPHHDSYLASGSDDHLVCVWDVQGKGVASQGSETTELLLLDKTLECLAQRKGRKGSSSELWPLMTIDYHTDVIGGVSFSKHLDHLLATGADDSLLCQWDIRDNNAKPVSVTKAHDGHVNSVSFCPVDEHLLLSGGSDRKAKVWDTRNMQTPLHVLEAHSQEVLQVEWAPQQGSVLATASADRRICLWDLDRASMKQTPEEAAEGQPELLFVHGGHTDKIGELSFRLQLHDDHKISAANHDDEEDKNSKGNNNGVSNGNSNGVNGGHNGSNNSNNNSKKSARWLIASLAEDNVLQVWEPNCALQQYRSASQLECKDIVSDKPPRRARRGRAKAKKPNTASTRAASPSSSSSSPSPPPKRGRKRTTK